jgi:lysophospholipase L1-like esterase
MKPINDRKFRRARRRLVLAVGLGAIAGCIDHEAPILVEPAGGPLFERYVALGNSITAGFQSGGIHPELQQQAYPVLLARKAGASFGVPLLSVPGCPPPLAGPPPETRRISDIPCALRQVPLPAVIQNLAVPGANVTHAISPLGTANTLNTLILGGRTQLDAMREAGPSLVSVWLGNNDALAAALQGNPDLLTPVEQFRSAYETIAGAIRPAGAQDALLIGVANPALMAPALQPGAYYWAMAHPPSPLAAMLQVDESCAPGTPGGSRLVSFLTVSAQLAANPAGPVTISCGPEAPFVLTAEELQMITARVAAFNGIIQQQAAQHGFLYVDPMTELFLPAAQDPDRIRKCQGLASATTPEQFATAVRDTCPGPTAPNFFGSYVSYDGFHPSSEAHAVIANVLARRLNAERGLSLPTN